VKRRNVSAQFSSRKIDVIVSLLAMFLVEKSPRKNQVFVISIFKISAVEFTPEVWSFVLGNFGLL